MQASFSVMIQSIHKHQAVSDAATTPQREKICPNQKPHKLFPAYIPPDPHFIGRDDIVDAAQAYFLDHCPVPDESPPFLALIGMPGTGKTSLARMIIQNVGGSYDYVFILSAASEPKLLKDFKDVFRLLDLGAGLDVPENMICGLVISHLTKTGGFLHAFFNRG
jgi:hypothetical protein